MGRGWPPGLGYLYGRRQAVNLGFNSDQTDNVLWRLQHGEIDGITPKLAIVMIGTNNATRREDPRKRPLPESMRF